MRRLTRTACPPTLATSAPREFARAKRYFVDDGKASGFTFRAYGNPQVKEALGQLSQFNCAYCEADYDVTAPVDAEHFRPKGGVEIGGDLVQPGYWWLAASWDNLLPSCIRCNRQEYFTIYDGSAVLLGKGNLFPIEVEATRATVPGAEAAELPLLIDPSIEEPSTYIRFESRDGKWLAVPVDPDPASLASRRARVSIDAYGLNRPGLVRKRSIYFERVELTVAQLRKFARRLDRLPADAVEEREDTEDDINLALTQLRRMTSGEDRFSGMLATFIRPHLATLSMTL